MKDMTHKQLIRATYVAAKYESAQTAQLLTELAGRLDGALAAARTACLERDASVRAEIEWEKAMMQAVGEDGIADVVSAIEKLKTRTLTVKLPERYDIEMWPAPDPAGEWYSRDDLLAALVAAGIKCEVGA
ncbi:hypothetical protein FR762_15545 [Enterobacter sp. E76]|nr:hypothetical protein FR762_15545 [Enterobacter sp. E76]